jgi:hypothetical protein
MADEEIPDNIDFRFLASQNARILAENSRIFRELGEIRSELGAMREQTKHIPQIRADVSGLQHAMAATRADFVIVKESVEEITEATRLIEGRLFRLERHAGFTKCPSMTSKWIQSAPARPIAETSSARREKSAESIDGAISGIIQFPKRPRSAQKPGSQECRQRRFPTARAR